MQPLELVDTVSEVRSRRDTWLACVGFFFQLPECPTATHAFRLCFIFPSEERRVVPYHFRSSAKRFAFSGRVTREQLTKLIPKTQPLELWC